MITASYSKRDMEEIKTPQEQSQEGATPASETKKKPVWKKVVGGIFSAILLVILVFCVVVVVQVKSSKKPFLFGYATFFVVSGSMEPTINKGEVILVERVTSADQLHKGDIITFNGKGGSLEGKVVTHRIISDGVVNGKITTCGDANHGISDEPIPLTNVIGKYVKTSAALTTVYAVFTSKYGFLFIVFIPLLILLIVQIVNFRRACRMDKDGKMPEEKTAEEIKEQAVKEREDEIKRKAVEEYLASKKRIEKAQRENKNKK